MSTQFLEPEQKALEINLNEGTYGSFAEIGAGQEVAQYFFKAGASSGTIAKTISAYDKLVSDDIYGPESTGRYVCESRVYKMLDHEYDLMLNRLTIDRPNCRLFAFADSIETINYYKTNRGQGWLGIRFQLSPQGEANEIVLHIELLDNDISLQQQAVGILGVNLVYACYNFHKDYKKLLSSLLEGIQDRVNIDLLRIKGVGFLDIDNRLVALELVKQGLTDVAMFNGEGVPMHPSECMYKKNLLVVRGSFRPASLRTLDRLKSAEVQFKQEDDLSPRGTEVLSEITLKDLCIDTGKVDEKDFLDRVNLLKHLGQNVMITNCDEYKGLINYISKYRIGRLGIVVGASGLLEIINSKYLRNKDGRLITSFGEIFTRNVRFYVYPSMDKDTKEIMTCKSLPIPKGIRYLFKHIVENRHIVDIEHYNKDVLHIRAIDALRMLQNGKEGWDKTIPSIVVQVIQEKNLFGYLSDKISHSE
jgi:hypothetical protein